MVDYAEFLFDAIWLIVLIPAMITGIIIAKRKHERRAFRALGFTIIVLPAFWITIQIMDFFF